MCRAILLQCKAVAAAIWGDPDGRVKYNQVPVSKVFDALGNERSYDLATSPTGLTMHREVYEVL